LTVFAEADIESYIREHFQWKCEWDRTQQKPHGRIRCLCL